MPDEDRRHDEPAEWSSLGEDDRPTASTGPGERPPAGPVPQTSGSVGVGVEHEMPIGGGSEPVEEVQRPDRAPSWLVPAALIVLAILVLLLALALGLGSLL